MPRFLTWEGALFVALDLSSKDGHRYRVRGMKTSSSGWTWIVTRYKHQLVRHCA